MKHFTIGRMMSILDQLGQEIEVSVSTRARPKASVSQAAAVPA